MRRERRVIFCGCESRPATVAPAGSTWGGSRRQRLGLKHSEERPRRGSASIQAVTRVNAEQASKRVTWEPTWRENREGRRLRETVSEAPEGPTGVLATACTQEEKTGNTGNPSGTEW